MIDGVNWNPRVVGVDYDTNRVALCFLPLDPDAQVVPDFVTVEYRLGKQDAFQAVRSLRSKLSHHVPTGGVVWWIEHAFGRGPTDFKLGRVQGAILASIPVETAANEVGPPEWKKGIGLPGNAKKENYLPILRGEIDQMLGGGADQLSEHEVDAFGIALYGRDVNWKGRA